MNASALAEVLTRADVWRGDQLASADLPSVPSGFPELDAELPGGGWSRGALTEVLVDGAGQGECSLLLPALAAVQAEGRWVVLVAPPHVLHAPAWRQAHIDLSRLLVVAPDTDRDAGWAVEHALASGAPGAVLCWMPRIRAAQVRRLQVAAASGSVLSFLLRPCQAMHESSAAPVRLRLRAASEGRLGVELLKRRGPPCRHFLQLTVPRPLARRGAHDDADLARTPFPATAARSAGTLFAA